MDRKQPEQPERQPALEIKPSKTAQERPLWQRIGAFVLIALIVAGTVACAFWRYL